MPGPLGAEGLHAGRSALERADWNAARSAFAAVLEGDDSAEAGDGLAQALWFLGDVTEAVALRERAFDDYVRLGRCDDAVRAAVWVSHQHMIGGRPSAARGWLARSERALEGVPACAGHGWVAVERARQSSSVQEQITHATRALAVGTGHGAERPGGPRASACWGGPRWTPAGGRRVCACSRRPWRPQRPAGYGTCTRWPRPTATSSWPAAAWATGSAPPSGASSSTRSPVATRPRRCSVPAERCTPMCWWPTDAGPKQRAPCRSRWRPTRDTSRR